VGGGGGGGGGVRNASADAIHLMIMQYKRYMRVRCGIGESGVREQGRIRTVPDATLTDTCRDAHLAT